MKKHCTIKTIILALKTWNAHTSESSLYQFLCLMVQNDNKDSKIFAFCQLKSIMKTTKKDEDHCENQRKSYEPKK